MKPNVGGDFVCAQRAHLATAGNRSARCTDTSSCLLLLWPNLIITNGAVLPQTRDSSAGMS
jgi:hypothetical protein